MVLINRNKINNLYLNHNHHQQKQQLTSPRISRSFRPQQMHQQNQAAQNNLANMQYNTYTQIVPPQQQKQPMTPQNNQQIIFSTRKAAATAHSPVFNTIMYQQPLPTPKTPIYLKIRQ